MPPVFLNAAVYQFAIDFHYFLNFFRRVVVLEPVCGQKILPDKTVCASGVHDAFLINRNVVSFRHELLMNISRSGILALGFNF